MQSKHSTSQQNVEHTQLREALRESQLLRELSELLSSSFDTTHILQVLVKRTTEVCEVARCAVWLLDPAKSQLQPAAYHFATHDVPRRFIHLADRSWHRSTLSFHNDLMERLQRPPGMLVVEDLKTESSMQSLAEKFFVHSVLLVALMREGRPVGLMSLDNPGRATTFTPAQQQLARAIGQQAAIAIDNARLYQEAQDEKRRAALLVERSQALYAVAQAINSEDKLTHVLAIALHHLAHSLHANDVSLVSLEQKILVREQAQRPRICPLADTYDTSRTTLTSLPHLRKAVQLQMPLFITRAELDGDEHYLAQQLDLHTGIVVPLLLGTPRAKHAKTRLDKQSCVGFIFICYKPSAPPLTKADFTFAQEIATHCATALEKNRILSNTERATTLAAERANMLDALFNAMSEGLLVTDKQGNVLLTNTAIENYFDKKHNIKQQVLAYLQKNPAFTLSGDAISAANYPILRALAGETVREERFQHRYPDGTQKSFVINVAPLLDDASNHIGMVCAFRDISKQVQAEHRLRGALDTLLHVVEAISGITTIDEILSRVLTMIMNTLSCEHGAIQLYDSIQQEFTTRCARGFEPQSLATWAINTSSTHKTMTIPITYKNIFLGRILLSRPLLTNPQAKKQSLPGTNTTKIPSFSSISPFSTWDITVVEGVAQFLGLAIEQVRWQQEAQIARNNEASMRESNELKDEFLAITAHEFRTPLTIILTNSQMMSRQLHKSPAIVPALQNRLDESISSIQEQTRHLTNIVNTFLEVTMFNRGQVALTLETVNIKDIIGEIINDYKTTASPHNISYQIQPSTSCYSLQGDPARLKQTFTNLLQNAIKYSPQGSPITISLRNICENEKVMIQVVVEDKGIGIPAEATAHLFERFYRAPSIGNSQPHGVGLGLYIVAEIVRLHGGTIYAESSGIIGEGSRFILTLPYKESTCTTNYA